LAVAPFPLDSHLANDLSYIICTPACRSEALLHASHVGCATPCHACTASRTHAHSQITNTSCHAQTVLCHTLCIVNTPHLSYVTY